MVKGTNEIGRWFVNPYGVPEQVLARCPECKSPRCTLVRFKSFGRKSYVDTVICNCHENFGGCPNMRTDYESDWETCDCKTCARMERELRHRLHLPVEVNIVTGEILHGRTQVKHFANVDTKHQQED